MKKYIEYKEIQVPENIQETLQTMAADENQIATFGKAGLFDWLTELSKSEGWTPVWQGLNFPYVVLQREVVVEES